MQVSGIDTLAVNDKEARRVDILREIEIVEIVPEPKIEIVAETQPDPVMTQSDPEPEPEPEPDPEPIPAETKKKFEWKNFTLRTNLLYWTAGMMNLGVEYKQPESNFGFVLNGGYSFFGNTNWNHNFGGCFLSPEVKYYLPCNERWFVGLQFLAAGFNYKPDDVGKQGMALSGGVMGGYKLTLTERFDMDFTLGIGYGHLKYDTYYHDESTNNNPRIENDLVINTIMPIQCGVNLIWKIK